MEYEVVTVAIKIVQACAGDESDPEVLDKLLERVGAEGSRSLTDLLEHAHRAALFAARRVGYR